MVQKYYAAERGSRHLSITNQPGELTESIILNNLERMIQADTDEENVQLTWKELRSRARYFYEENIERILEMAKLGTPLTEVSQEEAAEAMSLTFSEWELWEFPRVEWN